MIIDNTEALAYFDAADRVRYYNTCTDISLAGDDYKVMEIVFFASHPNEPFTDYIQVKKYDDRFLLLGMNTEDEALISECLGYATELVLWFSHDSFRSGAVPHYGYAISKESARVAEKCGYQCDHTELIRRTLTAK